MIVGRRMANHPILRSFLRYGINSRSAFGSVISRDCSIPLRGTQFRIFRAFSSTRMDSLKETDMRLKQYLKEYAPLQGVDIKDETSFEDVGLDSMGGVELVIFVEEKIGVRFNDSEALDVKTFRDLKVLVYKYLSEKRNKQELMLLHADDKLVAI